MSTSRNKPLAEWTDAEIDEVLRANAPYTPYTNIELVAERNRREARKLARLTTVAAVGAAVAAICSAIAAIVSAQRASGPRPQPWPLQRQRPRPGLREMAGPQPSDPKADPKRPAVAAQARQCSLGSAVGQVPY